MRCLPKRRIEGYTYAVTALEIRIADVSVFLFSLFLGFATSDIMTALFI